MNRSVSSRRMKAVGQQVSASDPECAFLYLAEKEGATNRLEPLKNISEDRVAWLMQLYREPLFAYFRAERLSVEDAEDLTHTLLMDFFLIKASYKRANPQKGRFRNYLFAAARNVLRDWIKHKRTQKQGGDRRKYSLESMRQFQCSWEPSEMLTPEAEYERHWALSIWKTALVMLKLRHSILTWKPLELVYLNEKRCSQREAAKQMGITVAAFNSRLHTARKRFGEILREVVRQTLDDPRMLDEEIERLYQILIDKN